MIKKRMMSADKFASPNLVIDGVASWITFGKDRYHLNGEMERWCRDNVGEGGWTYNTPKTWEGMEGKIWIMHSMFGNTTFAFKEAKYLTMFILRWS
jgi:hypothetical protein